MISTILVVSMALTATARADDVLDAIKADGSNFTTQYPDQTDLPSPSTPGVNITGWTLDVGPVAEMVPSSTAGALATVGIALDAGKRRRNVYLGVTGELGYIVGNPDLAGHTFAENVPSFRARAGVEIRYALMSWDASTTCFGNYQPPGALWVGLRAGGENVDGTFGGFADASFGFDHFYLRGGISVDPAGTYGQAAIDGQLSAGLAGPITPFIGAGVRLVFGATPST
jgi:hypothetical protein